MLGRRAVRARRATRCRRTSSNVRLQGDRVLPVLSVVRRNARRQSLTFTNNNHYITHYTFYANSAFHPFGVDK